LIEVARQRAFWPGLVAPVQAARAHLALRQGDLPLAAAWAATSGLQASDDLRYTHARSYVTLARVQISQGRNAPAGLFLAAALQVLDRLHSATEADGRLGDVVEILLLRSLALQAQGKLAAALTALTDTLTLAEPEGYVRIFVDEGPRMAALLTHIARGDAPVAPYAGRLLEAFPEGDTETRRHRGTETSSSSDSVISPSPRLIEPLSEREMEVLRLIAEGLSNQAIADRLIVAVSTIKKHVNNIYGKLNVQSRTQALLRARELKLL
jgi:LuxR family transcriptional regulator, maltose regulon positive regulatory protein